MPMFSRVRAVSGRLRRDRSGASAVEFALIAVPFLTLLYGIVELALAFLLSTSLENATAQTARKIRTGELQNSGAANAAGFKKAVCDDLGWLAGECQSQLYIDVRTFQTFDSVNMPQPVSNGEFNPGALTFNAGGPNEIVVVRAYYQWKLFTPLISKAMQTLKNGSMLVVSTATFRNEPYGS
jgi:Flp pilus assembly protein TadG